MSNPNGVGIGGLVLDSVPRAGFGLVGHAIAAPVIQLCHLLAFQRAAGVFFLHDSSRTPLRIFSISAETRSSPLKLVSDLKLLVAQVIKLHDIGRILDVAVQSRERLLRR